MDKKKKIKPEGKIEKREILEKARNNIVLTRDEEIFYLTEISGYTLAKAKIIIAIAANNNPDLLLD
jgi:formylmethanofuran dehydrogenase subunit E